MFALWYLSLAIDEVRKHFGWSSIFDISKVSNKAIKGPLYLPNKIVTQYGKQGTKVPENVPETVSIVAPSKIVELELLQPEAKLFEPQESSISIETSLKPVTPPSPTQLNVEPLNIKEPSNSVEGSLKPIIPPATTHQQQSQIRQQISPQWPQSKTSFGANNGPLLNTLEKNHFTSSSYPLFENAKETIKPNFNVKDATLSFLTEEGRETFSNKQKQDFSYIKRNKSETMVDAAVLQKLEDGFAKLAASDSKSLLKKYLTKEVFDNLKNKKTPTFGSTLLDCIQSGVENLDSGVGIYAPDAEAYSVFSDLFDPIIEDYHKGFKKTDKHPAKDFGDVSVFGNVDPNNEFVVSTRVRCGRSMEGYPFNPCLTEAQYKEMEQKVSTTLQGLEGELKGKFYPLTGMEKSVQQQLIDDHFLFKEGDRFLQAANACRFWPSGRGIYHNDAKTFLVWCNEEDHLRIISMQMGGDLGQVYRRLVTAVNDIEKRIPFSHHDRLGFLTFCPTNLGTTIRASVHIKLPKLAANKAKLEEIAGKYNLQVRGTRGEHTEAEGGVYDISNKRRMGLTEFEAVKEMHDGILELIKIEKSL